MASLEVRDIHVDHELRKKGYSIKAWTSPNHSADDESSSSTYIIKLTVSSDDAYPGARVGSEKDWEWTHRSPDGKQPQDYVAYVDKKLQISKDALFFMLCTGFGSAAYVPEFPGLENFKGTTCHAARWPKEGVKLAGKPVGDIGTGATGLQLVQEISKEATKLVVFQQTPNMALPMRQHEYEKGELMKMKETLYSILLRRRLQTFCGILVDWAPKSYFQATLEERYLFW
ncbi:hypothetical protein C8J56DRAFT_1008204 [Mycena floridula]|nr:hypothetical protein C8J56DRAFT_1008204 [Mycena floridula]